MKPEGKQTEPETYPLEMGYLSPKFLKKAETELNENAENRKSKIEEVRKYLKKEECIEDRWFTDEVIIMYLRSRKFDVKKTVATMKRMVAFVKKHENLVNPLDPQVFDKITKTKIQTLLSKRDEDGCTVYVVKLKNWIPSDVTYTDLVNTILVRVLQDLKDPMTQVNGVKVIYDFKAPLLRYLRHFSPFNMYYLYQLFVECVPVRIKGLYVVNVNSLAKIVQPMVFSLFSEKLKQRVKLHSDPTELLERMQENVVPVEYGGMFNEDEFSTAKIKTCLPDYVTEILNSCNCS